MPPSAKKQQASKSDATNVKPLSKGDAPSVVAAEKVAAPTVEKTPSPAAAGAASEKRQRGKPAPPKAVEDDESSSEEGTSKRHFRIENNSIQALNSSPSIDVTNLSAKGGHFIGDPIQAGKKAFSRIARVSGQKECSYSFTIVEMTGGKPGKSFSYTGRRFLKKDPQTIKKGDREIRLEYETEVRATKKDKVSEASAAPAKEATTKEVVASVPPPEPAKGKRGKGAKVESPKVEPPKVESVARAKRGGKVPDVPKVVAVETEPPKDMKVAAKRGRAVKATA